MIEELRDALERLAGRVTALEDARTVWRIWWVAVLAMLIYLAWRVGR